jgi:predicted PhzF superfamily epimerase YddE/YHI9
VSIELHQIVTFASQAFRGNPAMVLVSEGGVPPSMLCRLAEHLREPVVAALATRDGGLQLSFSTPDGPHPGAGHAAHAAAYVALTRLRPNEERIEFDLGGDRRMVAWRDASGPAVEWPIMPYAAIEAIPRVRACIGVEPVETYVSAFGLVAVLPSSGDVEALVPRLDLIASMSENTLTVTSPDHLEDFAIRVFAPRLGLPEDPVCGTAHRVVVPLWSERLGKTQLISRQLSPRGGRLLCLHGPATVTLAGAATPFFSGTIIPDLL